MMGRPNRVRRTLTLRVSERRTGDIIDPASPGQRFASGWSLFCTHGQFVEGGLTAACGGDPVVTAGFLAARAAWDAHHYAVNWIPAEQELR